MIYKNGRLETSYSQLDKFKKCPQQWKLRYVDKIYETVKNKQRQKISM